MIFHFFEVWLLLVAAFIVGCTMGALLYETVAASRMGRAQAVLAGFVGDGVERVTGRFGGRAAEAPVGLEPVRPQPAALPRGERFAALPPPVEREARDPVGAHAALEPPPSVLKEEGRAWEPFDADATEPEPAGGTSVPARADEFAADPAVVAALADAATADDVADVARRAVDAVRARRQRFREETVVRPAPAAALPAPSGTPEPTPDLNSEMRRPAGLAGPRNGVPDNLQRIRGIGEKNEARLNKLGIYHFGQIASWTPAEVRWIAQQLAFPERIERDDWVGQAIVLASGGDTGFTKSVERRRARRRAMREAGEAWDGSET